MSIVLNKKRYDWIGFTNYKARGGFNMDQAKQHLIVVTGKNNNRRFSLHLGETEVHPTGSFRFLGLVFDRGLSFHSHIEKLSKKTSFGIVVLRSLRNTVNTNVLVAAYYSLVYPHLAYSVPNFGSDLWKHFYYLNYRNGLRRLYSPCRTPFLLWVQHFNPKINFCQTELLQILTFRSLKPIDNDNSLKIPKHSSYFYLKHLIYNGVKLSNSLSLSFRLESNIQKFKRMLDNFFIGLTCYSVQDFLPTHTES